MNLKERLILEEYKKERHNFMRIEDIVARKLRGIVKREGILITGIEHRVKSEESLERKLYKKGELYQTMYDINDLLGARVICYFADDVDKFGRLMDECFVVHYNLSSDKGALMQANSFGYLSLHFICSLKKDEGYPEELTNKRFEVQVRTMLQHAWAAINHDLGYKTDFGVPREVVREFARLAGLLEIADNEFTRARDHIKEYTKTTREKIINDECDDINVDLISLREYMQINKGVREFLNELAKIEGSEITESSPDAYIVQLRWFGVDTLGKLQSMLYENRATALALARGVLEGSELDILASNVALRFICQAALIRGNYSEEEMVQFVQLSVKDRTRAENQVKRLIGLKKELNI